MNADNTTPESHTVIWLNNPFDLNDVSKYDVKQSLTIRQWLDRHGGDERLNYMPTVCVYDGHELLRSEYNQLIEKPVWFIRLPAGGDSGSNPIAAIAMIAMSVYVPGMVAGWGGVFAGTTPGSLSFIGAMTAGVIAAGGAAIIYSVIPPSKDNTQVTQASPTYSLGAQGNSARLRAPIPVNYGRMRIYPDFAANPYSEFESNEQYLYQLFCIGQGQNRISNIRLDNTSIENFAEVTTEIIPPMGKVTLFHTAVVTAPEAGGQDMTDPITLGPYTINDAGTEISRVACDIVFPGGLIGVDKDSGDEYSVWVRIHLWVEPIDDAGVVSGPAITVFYSSIWDETRTAIRRTLALDVPANRYQMTIQRTTDRGDDNEVRNLQLGSMKGYLVDDNEYGDVTLLAMRVRATANLSDAASRLVNVLNERLIPVWSPDNGWTTPTITRNPSWAFADAARSRYGGDFSDSDIDLNGLHYLAGLFDARGDYFDGRFDTEQSLWDGLGKIGQVCRSGPVRQGNLLRLIRDQHIDTPSQLFGMANMSEFSMDFVMHDDQTADSVKITFWDEQRDYAETTVLCQLPDDTADSPKDVTLFGCTQYQQAWREGIYLAASNRERRQLVSWKTGMEGHIPTFGDLVWVNHDLLGVGEQFGGTVAAVAGDVVTLSRDVALAGAGWYILIRDRMGEPSEPIPCEQVTDHSVRLLDTLPYIEEDPEKEPSHFVIGKGENHVYPVKVTAITPEDIDNVSIAGCIESEFVHTADQGQLPPPPPGFQPPPAGLDIDDLRASQGGTVQKPVVYLSWAFAANADRYLIEFSRDGGALWQPAGSGQSLLNNHEFSCEPGLMTCRVAAIAAVRGDWAEIEVNAGGEFSKPGKVQPVLSEPFEGNALKVQWSKEPAAARYLIEVYSGGSLRRNLYLDRAMVSYEYHWQDAQQDGSGRTLTVKIRAHNAEGVYGDWGELTATNPAPPIPDNIEVTGILNTLMVSCDPLDDPDIKELRVYGETTSGVTPSPANLLASANTSLLSVPVEVDSTWYVKLAWVDNWGATDLNFSGEYNTRVGPITETEIAPDSISTPMLKANAVVADKITADAITGREISSATTITAGTGSTTAGMNGLDGGGSLNGIRFWSGASENNISTADFKVDNSGKLTAHSGSFSGNISGSSGEFSGTVTTAAITSGTVSGTTISGGIIIGVDLYAGAISLPVTPSLNYPAGIGGTPNDLIIPVSAYPEVSIKVPMSNLHIYSGGWAEMHYIPIAANNNNQDLNGNRFRYSNASRRWYSSSFEFYDTGGNHGDRVQLYARLYRGNTLLASGTIDVFYNGGQPVSNAMTLTGDGVRFRIAGSGASNQSYFSVDITTPDITSGKHQNIIRGISKASSYRLMFSCGRRAYKASNVEQLITLDNSVVPIL